VLSAKILERSW